LTKRSSNNSGTDIIALQPSDWLEAIPEACFLAENRGAIIMANRQALSMLGSITGKSLDKLGISLESPVPDNIKGKEWETKATFSGKELKILFKSLGRSNLLLCFIKPAHADSGAETELEKQLKKTVDIHTRLLKMTEEKYRDLFESSSFGIVQIDPNGDWITFNPTFTETTGRDESALTNTKLIDIFHPEDKEALQKKLADWLAAENKDLFRCRLVRPDGSMRHLVIWAKRLETGGAITGLHLSIMDTTEETNCRLAAEAEKNQIRESLENIIRSMLEALVVVEPDGRIMRVNRALVDLLGWQEEELIGKPLGKLFAGADEDIAQETRKFARLLKASTVQEVEMLWRRPDGSNVPVSFNASIMRNPAGRLVGIVGLARDLRENRLRQKVEDTNKQLERALAELKTLDAAKNGLISMVGHELRGPLASIRGFSELMQDQRISNEERIEFAAKIVSEIDRLTRLVNDILDLAKLEAGKLRYRMEPSLIREVINNCINRAGPVANERKVTFKTTFEDCPPIVMDVDRMIQVVDNLLSNAIKFSNEGGEIEIVATDHKHFIKVAVRDHGAGIPEDHKEAVFNKFEQTPQGRRARVGTGLGMPISKLIVEEGHRGRIWFESEGVGKGTTFFFTIPKNLEPTAN